MSKTGKKQNGRGICILRVDVRDEKTFEKDKDDNIGGEQRGYRDRERILGSTH